MELKFVWEDDPEIGYYECLLLEDGKAIDNITFWDYTCEYTQKSDKKSMYYRPYAFKVSWCHGYSMSEGFDYDENYRKHSDGGYQGNCTHTVNDIKRWCEEWIAQRYINSYKRTVEQLNDMKKKHDWFKKQGYGDMELKRGEQL